MPELKFSDFMQVHGRTRFAISIAPYNGLPKNKDMNDREYPSPYELLSKWCGAYLKNHWAITQRTHDLLLVVESIDEETQLREIFNVSVASKITEAGKTTYSASYSPLVYNTLANALGYVT